MGDDHEVGRPTVHSGNAASSNCGEIKLEDRQKFAGSQQVEPRKHGRQVSFIAECAGLTIVWILASKSS